MGSSSSKTSSSNQQEKDRTPFKSSFLSLKQQFLNLTSQSSSSQKELKREYILQNYGKAKISKLQIYESPLNNSLLKISASVSSSLKHWEIIATINDCVYWLISFGQEGQQNRIHLEKQVLVKGRNENVKLKELPLNSEILVEKIIQTIQNIKQKQYNIGKWNCQLFVQHIEQSIKV